MKVEAFAFNNQNSILTSSSTVNQTDALFAETLASPKVTNERLLNTWILMDEDGKEISSCLELSRPLNLENEYQEAEDEVESLFATRKRHFQFDFECENDIVIRTTSFGCGKLGHQVWPSSIALCMYLMQHPEIVENKSVLELGAGCGLPSVLLRDVLGASSVVATDFWKQDIDWTTGDDSRLIPDYWHGMNLKYNVQVEKCGNAQVEMLDWHDLDSLKVMQSKYQLDVVIGSDLIYYESDVEPLWQTIESLLEEVEEVILFSPLAQNLRKALPIFRLLLQQKVREERYEVYEEIFQLHGSDEDCIIKMSITKF